MHDTVDSHMDSEEVLRLRRRVAELEAALVTAADTAPAYAPSRVPGDTDIHLRPRQRTDELARLNTRLQQEIVEHSRTGQRLRASQRSLLESQRLAGIGSWEYDLIARQAVWSNEMYRLHGQHADTFTPSLENLLTLVPPEDHAILGEIVEKAQHALHPEPYRHRIRHPNGAVRLLEGMCDRVREPDGTCRRIVGIVKDVTEDHEHSDALEQTLRDLRQFKEMVNRSPVVVAVWHDAPGKTVEFVSENIARFGYRPDDILSGRIRLHDLIHPEDRVRVAAEYEAHTAAARASFPMSYRILTAAGECRWVHEEITTLPSNGAKRFQTVLLDVTAEREAENRFHDALTLNEALIEAAPIGIAACDQSGQCIFVNPAMGLMINAPTDQILRQNINRLASWRLSGLLALAQKTLASGTTHSDIVNVTSSFGRNVWLDCSFTRFQRAGEPHLLVVFHDITQRRETEEQLRQTELRYRALAESIPDMIYLVEPDGRVIYANSHASRQFDLTPEALVGRRQQDLFSPDVAERHCQAIRAVAESGVPFALEVPDLLDSGKPVWIDTRLIPIRNPGGATTAVLGISRDVTERRRMVVSLEESEKRYRQLFECMTEGCTLYDLVYDAAGKPIDAQVTAINPAGEAIIGMSAGQLVGRRASALVPGNKPLFLEVYAALDQGGPPVSVEARLDFLSKDLLLYFSCPRKGTVAAIYTDITARKAAEARMLQYQQQLRHLAAEIAMAGEQERRRIAVELHDGLGQALVLCKMKLEAVKAEAEGAALRRQIRNAVRLIEEAIRDTRSLTFQLSPPVLHEIGLNAAIEWLAEHLGEEHGMKIRVTRQSPSEPASMAVRVILFQAVRELVLNVIKHAHTATITIAIETVHGNLEIRVEDDGAGFDARAQQGTTRNGMGLFNIRERVQLVGGVMTLESEPGKGTRVTLIAPLEALPADNRKGPPP